MTDIDWLLREVDGFGRNTLLWAAHWIRDGMPADPYPAEHHTITARLAPFRKALAGADRAAVDAVAARLTAVSQ